MNNWVDIDFTQVVDKISTNGKKVKQKDYLSEGRLPVIDQGQDFIGGYSNDEDKRIEVDTPVIVFGDHTKAVKLVKQDFVPGADGVKVLCPKSFYSPQLLAFFIKVLAKKIPDKGYARHFQFLEKEKIPLLADDEQRQLVSIIEQLFSDLDNAIDNLKKAKDQFKVYRQAVLKYAFEGKLTEKWRKNNNLGFAEAILKYLSKTKRVEYEKMLISWKKALKEWKRKDNSAKRPLKPKIAKDLPAFKEKELKELPSLPKQWMWVKIDKALECDQHALKAGPFGSSLKKSCYVKKGYKIYGQEQVIVGDPYCGNYYISKEKYLELYNCRVKPGDVLLSLVGTAGRVLVLPNDIKSGIINPRLIKLSFNKKAMLPKFFKYYFESSFSKAIYKLKAHGATMDILNVGIIKELPFPFCSIEEQNQIVQEIESRFSVSDKMEETIADSLSQIEALHHSILKQAFEGKLTDKWRKEHSKLISGENSAKALLERIKAERETLRHKRKKTK